MELKSIVSDSTLLMPGIVESGQTEYDECHHAKISGAKEIQQSSVSSSPDATVKFGLIQVLTQLLEHLEQTKSSSTDQSSWVTRSAAQVLKDLHYTIPRLNPASDVGSTSKEETMTKADDEDKQKVEIDGEGFKIPQRIAHHAKKKL